MQHPCSFIREKPSLKSPIFWNKTHRKIGLNELLCSLEQEGSFITSDGSKASFPLIVKSFEEFLNVKLGDPQEIKRSIYRRKTNVTKYLDTLRHALINYVDKIYH